MMHAALAHTTTSGGALIHAVLAEPPLVLPWPPGAWPSALTTAPIIDVRSPGEYAHAHWPGAHNVPLLEDAGRAAVGTAYKQFGRDAAIELGWELVKPRLDRLVQDVTACANGQPVVVYCARGGLRSRSIVWWLRQHGVSATRLEGGYKTVRRMVLDRFDAPARWVVLGGPTGSGKTAVLRELQRRGEQVIDLEGLAHHKGSAFGAIGEAAQPSCEHFENRLACAIANCDPTRRIWVEDESQRIGACAIPAALWQQMRVAPVVQLDVPAAARAALSVATYGGCTEAELIAAVRRIAPRLGGARASAVCEMIARGALAAAAQTLLDYYDSSYAHATARRASPPAITVQVPTTDPQIAADALLAASRDRFQQFSPG